MSTHDARRTTAPTAWKPLTADDVRRHTFRNAPLGRRGCRQEDVNLYVSRLATEIQRWAAAYDAATAEVERLRNYFRQHGVDPAPRGDGSASLHEPTVLTRAQEHANQLVTEARAAAGAMLADARVQAQTILAEARQEADRIAQDCRQAEATERRYLGALRGRANRPGWSGRVRDGHRHQRS